MCARERERARGRTDLSRGGRAVGAQGLDAHRVLGGVDGRGEGAHDDAAARLGAKDARVGHEQRVLEALDGGGAHAAELVVEALLGADERHARAGLVQVLDGVLGAEGAADDHDVHALERRVRRAHFELRVKKCGRGELRKSWRKK